MKKLIAMMLAVLMVVSVFAGCGGNQSQAEPTTGNANEEVVQQGEEETVVIEPVAESKQLKELTTTANVGRDLSTLCILKTTSPLHYRTSTNYYEPLINMNAAGQYVPGLAESWKESDDGLTWSFKIRSGAQWVNYKGEAMAEITAEDFLWGMEWILNHHKNGGSNKSIPTKVIPGAKDYYEYTKSLTEEEGRQLDLTKFLEMVDVEVVDGDTVVYHLYEKCHYFLSYVTGIAFYPVSGQFLNEIGVENFITCPLEKMWFSGPYILTEWVENNTKIQKANPLYWNEETELFETWTIVMIESNDIGYQMYLNGEVDEASIDASYAQMISANPSDENYGKIVSAPPNAVAYSMYFNYGKRNDDGSMDTNWNTAVANEAFRKSIYFGADLTNYLAYTNFMDPLSISNNTLTAYNISKLSDGRDYTDLVLEKIGVARNNDTYPHMDSAKAESYKQQAISELTAEGVTFPVEMVVWCANNQSYTDELTLFKECIEDCLGADYITVTIKNYVSSASEEVIDPALQSIMLDGAGASYMDPTNYLYGYTTNQIDPDDGIDGYGNVSDCGNEEIQKLFDDYTVMLDTAAAIDDADARLEAIAEAEAFLINHALVIPTRNNRTLSVTRINHYTKAPMTNNMQYGRMVNVETNEDGYTTEEYNALYKAYVGG